MGLSRLDSKKCQTILHHKSHITKRINNGSDINSADEPIISDEANHDNKEIDAYGEVAVKYLKELRKEFTCDEIDEVVAAYQSGKTTFQLAEQFDCSKTTINKLLKKQGVNVTRSKAQAKLDTEIVIAMYAEMHTTEEIAERFKVNPQTILRCLRNHGVKIRSRWDYVTK